MSGRPSKISEEIIENATRLLALGNYVQTICQAIGIDNKTWYNWIKKGKEENKKSLYYKFFKAVQKAESTAEIRAVALIQKAMLDDWRCAFTYLERKFPLRWGRNMRGSVENLGDYLDIRIVPIKKKRKSKK